MRTHQNSVAKFIDDCICTMNECFYDSRTNKPIVKSLLLVCNESLGSNLLSQTTHFLLKSITTLKIVDTSRSSIPELLASLQDTSDDSKHENHLKEVIAKNLNLIVYGRDALQEQQHLIKTLYVLKNYDGIQHNAIVLQFSKILSDYGGAIGIRFFPSIEE